MANLLTLLGVGGTGGIFAPPDFANMTLWLKADSLSLNTNDPVATWTDSSNAGNNATQGTAGFRPTYQGNIVNGMPSVRFDGTDDFLATAVPVTTVTDNWTMISVVESDDNSSSGRVAIYNGLGASNGYGIYPAAGAGGTSGKIAGLFGSVAWLSTTVNTPADNSFNIYVFRRTAGTYKMWLNGSTNIRTGATVPVAPTTGTYIGGDSSTPIRFGKGDSVEHMVYASSLSDADVDTLGQYLAAKYGLTWTSLGA